MSRAARYITAAVVTALAAAGAYWDVLADGWTVGLVGLALVALGALEVDVVKIKDWLTLKLGDNE